ncbi:hypothetical protein GGS26DRAFT_591016 [Hypomontagnella submonticulosa]|nr:hypothetical protein GGS26DRAFT_591016 [Hypomontagnella submonticulosa]
MVSDVCFPSGGGFVIRRSPPYSWFSLSSRQLTPALQTKRAPNYCVDSSFINQMSGGSPPVGDCATVRDASYGSGDRYICSECWLPGHGWPDPSNCYNPAIWRGTYVFGVVQTSGNVGMMGSDDIGDIVRYNMNQFQ